jgi:anaerobic ribonucleoside-triphosphate reductase
MSNHDGSYMLRDVLTLLDRAGIWEQMPRAKTQQLVIDIVKLAYDRYDCNAGEILEGHEELGVCYNCRKPVAALRHGLCQECGWDEEEEGDEDV